MNNISTLIQIIDKIEDKRISRINKMQEFNIGKTVKHKNLIGKVIEISPQKTSIIVEFSNKTKKRFFVDKRANKLTLDNLSLHKVIEEVNTNGKKKK